MRRMGKIPRGCCGSSGLSDRWQNGQHSGRCSGLLPTNRKLRDLVTADEHLIMYEAQPARRLDLSVICFTTSQCAAADRKP